MDQELKAMAEKAGLSYLPWDESGRRMEWSGDDAELAEFAALIAERCAAEARSDPQYSPSWLVEQLATRWRNSVSSPTDLKDLGPEAGAKSGVSRKVDS